MPKVRPQDFVVIEDVLSNRLAANSDLESSVALLEGYSSSLFASFLDRIALGVIG